MKKKRERPEKTKLTKQQEGQLIGAIRKIKAKAKQLGIKINKHQIVDLAFVGLGFERGARSPFEQAMRFQDEQR